MPVARGLRTSAMLSENLVLPACLLQRVAQRQEHFRGEATVRGLVPRFLHRVRHLLGRERRERVHRRAVVQAELRELGVGGADGGAGLSACRTARRVSWISLICRSVGEADMSSE
jgi:hypothetical protein